MIIPSQQELVQLVARNVSSVGDNAPYSPSCGGSICCGKPLCEVNMFFFFFIFIIPWLLIISLVQALLMPRNLVALLVWCITFSGLAITLQRRGVRMPEARAEGLRALLRARGFDLLVRDDGFFARRRKLSLSAGVSAAVVASVMAYIVWAMGGVLGYPAHP